jgi:hypothetical protein
MFDENTAGKLFQYILSIMQKYIFSKNRKNKDKKFSWKSIVIEIMLCYNGKKHENGGNTCEVYKNAWLRQ